MKSHMWISFYEATVVLSSQAVSSLRMSGFAFKKDSPLDMSTEILKLSDNGMLQNMTDKWLKLKKRKGCGQKSRIVIYDSDQIQVEDLMVLFLICRATIVIALFIHLFSIMDRFHSQVRSE